MKVTLWENSTSKIHYNEGSLDFASFPKEGKITWVYKQNMSEKALISSFKNSVLEIDFKLCQLAHRKGSKNLTIELYKLEENLKPFFFGSFFSPTWICKWDLTFIWHLSSKHFHKHYFICQSVICLYTYSSRKIYWVSTVRQVKGQWKWKKPWNVYTWTQSNKVRFNANAECYHCGLV